MSFYDFSSKTVGSIGAQHPNAIYNSGKSMALSQFGSDQGFSLDRFAPNVSDLGRETLVQSWLPKDSVRLNKFLRNIYTFDAIVGPAIDLITTLPFSEAVVTGINDKKILDLYQDCVDTLEVHSLMIQIAKEYLIIGRAIGSMVFDEGSGIWTSINLHDSEDCLIKPVPIRDVEPKIDLIVDSDLRSFLLSKDPRDIEARKSVTPNLLNSMMNNIRGNKLPLDPLTTLFVARHSSPKDYIGTSLFYRIVPFVILENALISGTVIASQRRQRSILHLTVGDNDNWIPTPEEMSTIAQMFMSADEDPQGAIVATRPGVSSSELRSGGDFWKASDEWDFLSRAKMTALGISEAFLSGEATFATMDTALSVFMESMRSFRLFLTSNVFYKKVFPMLARVHGFVKLSEAELSHRVRTTNYKGMDIPKDKLLIPQLEWLKQLRPEADRDYLDILTTMEEKGLPIPLTTWAASGGINIDRIMSMQSDDILLRRKVKLWIDAIKKSRGDEEAFGSTRTVGRALDKLPIWDNKKEFLGIRKKDIVKNILGRDIDNVVSKGNKSDIYNYILTRLGISSGISLSSESASRISKHVASNSGKYKSKKIVKELMVLNSLVTRKDRKIVKSPIKKDIYSQG